MANTYGIKSVSGSLQELEMSRYGGTEYSVLTASSGQAGITLQNIASGTVTHFTSSYAKITNLDVDVINTIATTQTTLEIADKLIIAASGANSANSDGGGLQIGGVTSGNPIASVKYDHANTALDFNIGSTTQVLLKDGAFLPETDSDVDLGTSTKLFKNLYVDAFGANWTNAGRTVADLGSVTTVDINGGTVDGVTIGGGVAANGTFLTLSSSAADLNGGTIDGVAIGLTSSAAGKFTTLNVSDGNITNVGSIALDSITADDGSSFSFGSNWTAAGRTCADLGSVTTADINGGTVDGTTIGGGVAANGTFLTLSSSAADLNGGTVDGCAIGLTSSAAGAFTTLDCNDGAFAVANLDIDGASDIGADLADADLFIVDDGAGGANRKSVMSRIPTYLNNHANLTQLTSLVAVGTISTGVWNGSVIQDAYVANNLTLSGSTMNNSVIGGVQPAAGTFTTLDCNDGAFAVANLDIDGATDIGANLVDADLFMVDDGGAGTNRKSAMSRIPTYLNNHANLTSLTGLVAVGALDAGSITSNFGNINIGTSAMTAGSLTDGTATLTSGVLTGLTTLGASNAPVTNVFATNVVTGDFHMRNERGDWTLFEESDHIRIRNNKTGQTFKMGMTLIEE